MNKDASERETQEKQEDKTPTLLFEHGYALFIGIRYGHWKKGNPLNGTLRDTKDLYDHFTHPQKAAYKPENIILLQEENATKLEILNALATLAAKANQDPNATVIIYYSGHGIKNEHDFFLVPYDFDLLEWLYNKDVEENEVILSTDFAEKIAAIQVKKCLVILDCCHSENIPVERKGVPSFLKGFVEDLDNVLENNVVEKGLATEVKKGKGRVILTSCQANEKSLDLGSNGLFTQVLLECLNGINNIEKDGWVRLTDMIHYIPKTVAERARRHQNNGQSHQQNPVFKRIEDLGAEEFIVCAYDIVQAKGFNKKRLLAAPNTSNISKITELIDNGSFVKTFAELDEIPIDNQFQYNRLKREFSAGLKGIDLLDFAERLKVFINELK